MNIEIIPTTPEHVLAIRDALQDDDKREISGYGVSCAKATWRTYRRAVWCRTALIDGIPAAFWGVAGIHLGRGGIPFLLTSRHVRKISPLRFTRIYQLQLKEMLKIYPKLENWVLSDYHEAVRLLQIVGFTIGDPQPLGRHGLMYSKFSLGEA